MSVEENKTSDDLNQNSEDDVLQFHPDFHKDMAKIEAEDPEAAAAFREIFANMRQAMTAFKAGTYDSFDDAMEAITGQRPQRISDDDEDYD